MNSKYLPYIIGGGALLVLFFFLRSGGTSAPAQVAPVVPPRFSSIQAGPTDYSYDFARLQADLARSQLAGQMFGLVLQRDFALKQLSVEERANQAQLALQEKALTLDYQRNLQEQFLNVRSMGGF